MTNYLKYPTYNEVKGGDRMAKRFKARRKRKLKKKLILMVILFLITFVTTFKMMQKIKIGTSHKEMISYMLEDTNHYVTSPNKKDFVQSVGHFLFHFDATKPLSILSETPLYQHSKDEKVEGVLIKNDTIEDHTTHAVDPNPIDITKPKVYLYNTHQTEEYTLENAEIHNITPNVMFASYVLKEKLNHLEIPTIVEEKSVVDQLNQNHWAYYKSYLVSKQFMKDAIENYPTLTYFIDIHRDGLKKEASTAEINGVKYAKILFVVGLDNPSYQQNLELANKVNAAVKEKYPALTRGVTTKKGDDVNGIYNQDVNGNVLLLECGGNENTIEEVSNTMNVFAEVFKEVIE